MQIEWLRANVPTLDAAFLQGHDAVYSSKYAPFIQLPKKFPRFFNMEAEGADAVAQYHRTRIAYDNGRAMGRIDRENRMECRNQGIYDEHVQPSILLNMDELFIDDRSFIIFERDHNVVSAVLVSAYTWCSQNIENWYFCQGRFCFTEPGDVSLFRIAFSQEEDELGWIL